MSCRAMPLPSPAPGVFSAALLSRSHIRIDTLYVRVRTRVRAALDLLSLVTFGSFIALITWHAWGVVRQSWVSGSRSLSELETPRDHTAGAVVRGPGLLRLGCAAAARLARCTPC